jgi:glycosyltransferase involved in cell wall biosynthesis
VSAPASVWWYREGHRHYLEAALRHRLERGEGEQRTIYAQCPVSADAALRVRTTEPVALVVHFNVSQADEWAEKGEIAPGGRMYDSIRALEERVVPAVDGLVYVSRFMRGVVHERIPAARSVPSLVAPNFVEVADPGDVAPDRDIVTVGSLEPRKNQGFLLEVLAAALRRGHRYTLTVIGDGPDRPGLEQQARALGVQELVRFAGFVADPRAALRRHRVYCHAARMENLSVALIEALAEGLPLIAPPTGGNLEIVRPGVDGEVWSLDDPEAASEVLVGLLSDGPRLATLGANARAGARDRFAGTVVAPRLLGFLDQIGPGPARD